MIFLKTPYLIVAALVLCAVVFYLANTGKYFGKFINKFFPCEQNPANSLPCFGHYDIYVMIGVALVALVLVAILGLDIYKSVKQ